MDTNMNFIVFYDLNKNDPNPNMELLVYIV